MTGHNHFRRHNYIIAYREFVRGRIPIEEVGNPYCNLCHVPVEAPLVPPLRPMEGVPLQTSGHLFAECGYLNAIRERIFGIPNALAIETIKKTDILRFCAEAKLKILPKDHELSDNSEFQEE